MLRLPAPAPLPPPPPPNTQAYPCNQFGAQESGSPDQIRKWVAPGCARGRLGSGRPGAAGGQALQGGARPAPRRPWQPAAAAAQRPRAQPLPL
jgi:hypothetical protein